MIDSLANAIKDGYIVRRKDGSLFVTSPAFTLEQTEDFNKIVETYLIPHIDEYSEIVNKFVKGYKKLFPKHLQDDADRMCHGTTIVKSIKFCAMKTATQPRLNSNTKLKIRTGAKAKI